MKDSQLNRLKKEYDSIPIPPELEERVRRAVSLDGQTAPAPVRRSRPVRRLWRRGGMAACAALLSLVVLANSGPSAARALEQIPVLGAITRVFTFRTYQDDRGNTSARVEIPQVEGDAQALNEAVRQYTDAIIRQYEQDAQVQGELGHYQLQVRYSVATDTDALFALRFDQTQVMASGVESVRIYVMDKASGALLTLEDLFLPESGALDALTREIQEQMRARMEADPDVYYWLEDEVEAWNFTALSPDADFYLNAAGELVIVFDEGEVAPMYMGVCEFAIPSSVTAPLARDGYLG